MATTSGSTVDDYSSLISYDSDWAGQTDSTSALGWYGNTLHYSQKLGSSARFTFTGTSVYVYGVFDNDHGDYTVTIGSFTTPHLSSYSAARTSNKLLLSATCLPLAEHTLALTNQDNVLWTNLDYIVYSTDAASNCNTGIVYTGPSYNLITGITTSPPTGTAGAANTPPTNTQNANTPNSPTDSQILSAGAIAGIVVGAVAIVVLALVAFFLWKRNKRQQLANPPPAAAAWTGGPAAGAPHYLGKTTVASYSQNALGYIPPDQLEQQWVIAGAGGAAAGMGAAAGARRVPMVVEPYGGAAHYQQPPIDLSAGSATAYSGSNAYPSHPNTPPLPLAASVSNRSPGVMSPPPGYQYPARSGMEDDKQLLHDLQEKAR